MEFNRLEKSKKMEGNFLFITQLKFPSCYVIPYSAVPYRTAFYSSGFHVLAPTGAAEVLWRGLKDRSGSSSGK